MMRNVRENRKEVEEVRKKEEDKKEEKEEGGGGSMRYLSVSCSSASSISVCL